MSKYSMEEMIGKKYGRWTVDAIDEREKFRVFCTCDCGKRESKLIYPILNGDSKSCGCLKSEKATSRNTKHGMASRGNCRGEYIVWCGIKERCNNKNSISYPYYGGSGITMCDGWSKSFQSFFDDMGPRPEKFTIDRKNNGLGYNCGHCEFCSERGFELNCRWSSRHDQAVNRSITRWITINGTTKCLSMWIKEAKINPSTFYRRIKSGMTDEQALFSKINISRS